MEGLRLIAAGENDNEKRKRDARNFLVTDEQWRTFYDRHRHLPCYVPEDNASIAVDKGKGIATKSESTWRSVLEQRCSRLSGRGILHSKRCYCNWGRSDTEQQSGCGGGDKKVLES